MFHCDVLRARSFAGLVLEMVLEVVVLLRVLPVWTPLRHLGKVSVEVTHYDPLRGRSFEVPMLLVLVLVLMLVPLLLRVPPFQTPVAKLPRKGGLQQAFGEDQSVLESHYCGCLRSWSFAVPMLVVLLVLVVVAQLLRALRL